MPITLGSVTFDVTRTTVDELLEEVGGRDARVITLRGMVDGMDSVDDIEARLDAIAAAASVEEYTAILSLRPGRRYGVRRARYKRDVARSARVGTFELVLEAQNPFEESLEETRVAWSIAGWGVERAVATIGNAETLPTIALQAIGNVSGPTFDDGVHRITYTGAVADGETLLFDGIERKAWLNGNDVTPYTTGEFPGIRPGGTTLVYRDDPSSSHRAQVTISFRDRWW